MPRISGSSISQFSKGFTIGRTILRALVGTVSVFNVTSEEAPVPGGWRTLSILSRVGRADRVSTATPSYGRSVSGSSSEHEPKVLDSS